MPKCPYRQPKLPCQSSAPCGKLRFPFYHSKKSCSKSPDLPKICSNQSNIPLINLNRPQSPIISANHCWSECSSSFQISLSNRVTSLAATKINADAHEVSTVNGSRCVCSLASCRFNQQKKTLVMSPATTLHAFIVLVLKVRSLRFKWVNNLKESFST